MKMPAKKKHGLSVMEEMLLGSKPMLLRESALRMAKPQKMAQKTKKKPNR